MTRLLGVMLLVFFTLPAMGQWSSPVIAEFKSLNSKYKDLDNVGLSTFWGGWKRWAHINFNEGETIAWKSPLFKHGELPMYLSKYKKKAPLIVFMPGIFGTTNKGLTPRMVSILESYHAHVMVLPNLISTQYISAYPLYGGDIVENEVQVMDSALDYALKELGTEVTEVHLIAESLGTMVGSAWAAWDVGHLKRFSSVTLLSPPIDLPVALKNFDTIIDEYRPDLAACSKPHLIWKIFTNFILSDIPHNLTLQEKRCYGANVLVGGFLKAGQKAYLAYVAETKDPISYQVKNFEDLFRHYRPELWKLLENRDERLKLGKWMRKVREQSSIPVRILTSRDDFLNRGLSWADFMNETKLPNDHVLIMDFGGHSGMIGMDEFPGLLGKAIFSN